LEEGRKFYINKFDINEKIYFEGGRIEYFLLTEKEARGIFYKSIVLIVLYHLN
jgi:hypothetical protein